MRKLTTVLFACLLALAGCSSSAGDSADFNDADVMFAQMMIPHHEQAIEMATMAEAASTNKEVLALAADIKAAQQPEIDKLTGWLKDWDKPTSSDMGGHDMGGMMSEEQMAELKAATGAQFDQLWLQMMIEHHQGAIDMAKAEISDGKNVDAIEMAKTIEKTQQQEIDTMNELLSK
ncbi:DUF305 domain-containing protein [Epidermidibacterium keratini]|uniref:DUF305 domain-containing protein n=1 Tax=Epidermidibacterium keratini TaxID=1891644 RepID=A0A7L4YPJ6_9ACTN|nr:DUF305 domain-containing protein [Epidermidibacterium keratini]QHC00988.1 DUF305 domain-containing protein [Epidermidibacterium keratini]